MNRINQAIQIHGEGDQEDDVDVSKTQNKSEENKKEQKVKSEQQHK